MTGASLSVLESKLRASFWHYQSRELFFGFAFEEFYVG
jgi:hypothetical protein